MLVAAWALAVATAVLALTSMVAVATWRESKRKQAQDAIKTQALEQARKEFAPKENVTNLTTVLGIGAVLAVLAMWPTKKD